MIDKFCKCGVYLVELDFLAMFNFYDWPYNGHRR